MLSNVFINSDKASVSGSENGFGPAYISEHGFVDDPASTIGLDTKYEYFNFKMYFIYAHRRDGNQNFGLDQIHNTPNCKVGEFFSTFDSMKKNIISIK